MRSSGLDNNYYTVRNLPKVGTWVMRLDTPNLEIGPFT